MATFTLTPTSYTTTRPDEVVALDLAISGLPYVGYPQSINININGTDYYVGRYSNLTGADPWHIPFSFPNVPSGDIPPLPPTEFPAGTYTIYFQSCDQNGVNDGLAVSNTASITLSQDTVVVKENFSWLWLLLGLLGAGAVGYYVYKRG